MFVLLAAIFALGLTPRFAQRFYPDAPGFLRRLAAPILFALLAAVCFLGEALLALGVTAALGIVLICFSRWKTRKSTPTA